MKIDVVISDPLHPLVASVRAWAATRPKHRVRILRRLALARGGDSLVLVACHEIARPEVRARYRRVYVTHASDLPKGRGWSPLVWSVLEGKTALVVSLIEAADLVDSGGVYAKFRCRIARTDLWSDVNEKLGRLIVHCLDSVVDYPNRRAKAQKGRPTWHPQRSPQDSQLDPCRSLAAQFDLLRACDPARFPAFFNLYGERFEITIRKAGRSPK
jgi:methionyl-tRNA formyltransferase